MELELLYIMACLSEKKRKREMEGTKAEALTDYMLNCMQRDNIYGGFTKYFVVL